MCAALFGLMLVCSTNNLVGQHFWLSVFSDPALGVGLEIDIDWRCT